MKAVIEFNLSDPEDREEHNVMLHALDMQTCLLEIYERLRSVEKYGADPITRGEFYNMIEDYNLQGVILK